MRRSAVAVLLTALVLGVGAVPGAAPEAAAAKGRPAYCDVTYSVEGAAHRAMRRAMRDITRASGVTFRRVPVKRADLNVVMLAKNRDNVMAQATLLPPRTLRSTDWQPVLLVYPVMNRYNFRVKRSVYQHELGHNLGMRHHRNPREVMYGQVAQPAQLGTPAWKSFLARKYARCKR